MKDVVIKTGETKRQAYTQRRMPYEDTETEQRGHVIMKANWSSTGTGQGTPKTAVNHQKLTENTALQT